MHVVRNGALVKRVVCAQHTGYPHQRSAICDHMHEISWDKLRDDQESAPARSVSVTNGASVNITNTPMCRYTIAQRRQSVGASYQLTLSLWLNFQSDHGLHSNCFLECAQGCPVH